MCRLLCLCKIGRYIFYDVELLLETINIIFKVREIILP